MESQKMGEIYQKIANKLNDIIPGDWNQIYLYAEVIHMDSTLVYFYFNTEEEGQYYYYFDIPDIYSIERSIFKDMTRELFRLMEELHEEFRTHNDEVWTNLTLSLSSLGKFNTSYGYEDVLSSEITIDERRLLFKYKHLDLIPEDEQDRQFVEAYFKKHGQ